MKKLSLTKLAMASALLLGTSALSVANAQNTAQGYIDVKLELLESCSINDNDLPSNETLGTLDFGKRPAREAGEFLASGGEGGQKLQLHIKCATAQEVKVTLSGGLHDDDSTGGYNHAMQNKNVLTSYVPYSLYVAGATKAIEKGGEILTAKPEPDFTLDARVDLDAKAELFSAADYAAGEYADQLTLLVEF